MKEQGFTLLELLVVVLIIGILVSIAVPKYQRSVIKSRYNTIKDLVKSIKQAQQVYFLAHGKFADDFAELDITMPGGRDEAKSSPKKYVYSWGNCHFGSGGKQAICQSAKAKMQYQLYLDSDTGECISLDTDINSIPNKICMEETRNIQTTCSHKAQGYCGYAFRL